MKHKSNEYMIGYFLGCMLIISFIIGMNVNDFLRLFVPFANRDITFVSSPLIIACLLFLGYLSYSEFKKYLKKMQGEK